MLRARTWLIGLACLLSLAVLAIWQVPQWLDWTRYRETIEALASVTLGRPVTIQGPIALTLLPEPMLSATQVDVGAGGSSSELSIRMKALRLRVALWPLLGGRVDARELVLRGADMHLPWPIETGALRAHPPTWLAAFTARIEDGRLTIGRLAFTDIDATLQSEVTGALSATGTARFNGEGWQFTARITSSGPDGSAGLNATLDGEGNAAGLGASLAGQWGPDGTFTGTISSRGPNLAVLLPAPPVPFRADGRLTVGGGLAIADNLTLKIGDSPASGAVALRVSPIQRLDIALSASRLDLDAWLPVLLRASNAVAGIDLPIGIDFSAEAAPLGGATLENVRAAFDLSDQALALRDGKALLPGNGKVSMNGRINRNDPAHPRFEGDATLEAPVLRTTLHWLQAAAPGLLPPGYLSHLPDGVLQRAAVSAQVTADADEVLLRHIAGSVDASSIAGSIGFERGAPPSVAADLTLDRVALDDWLPRQAPADLASMRLSTSLDAELRLNIGSATLDGDTLHGVAIDAGLEAGALALRRLDAEIDGMRVSASGHIGANRQVSDGKLSVGSRDATPIAAMLPEAWRATPALWHGPIQLSVQAAGPPEALSLSVQLALADATLDATPTIDLRSGQWNGELTLRHPGARRLLATLGLPELIGLPDLPQWLGDGSLALVAHLGGTPSRTTADSFDLTAGGMHFAGNFALDENAGQPHLSGKVTVDSLPLPLPSGASGVPLPIGLLHGWSGDLAVTAGSMAFKSDAVLRDTSMTVTVANDALRVDRFAGKLGGGALTGSFLFNGAASPPSLALHARLDGATIDAPLFGSPVDVVAGTAQGSLDLSANGYSPATIVSTLTGHLATTVTDGTVSGFDLPGAKLAAQKSDPVAAEKAAGDALNGGTTSFDRLEIAGSLAHGDLALDTAQLHSSAGEADATGDANLPSQELDLRIALRPALDNPPEIAFRLTGPLDDPERQAELANLARFVAERAH